MLTLVRRPLTTWVFIANTADKLILGVDVLRVNDASMDLRQNVIRLGDEEVSLWHPGA